MNQWKTPHGSKRLEALTHILTSPVTTPSAALLSVLHLFTISILSQMGLSTYILGTRDTMMVFGIGYNCIFERKKIEVLNYYFLNFELF
ncbi:hypothetical protein NC653_027334 [Populus alba x Populus x berolinensis]|uniref:Uncharacterized protein n=1 Tax=Populus alba x Populus x berolinensis TaxID=444605 RepID=A0AAD6Q4P2_9ROSI|nr:hypothetical protein NC653_027334 [Populus alba x Populus x berolinensis]